MPTQPSSDSGKQMFRWFLKPRFYSKCHTYVKFIKTRLETIEKKRNAVQKLMKGDIAELLRNGLDYDAYRRVEGLILEQNMSYCYELIAKFIGCISDNLQELTKQSDCPDECKEAVPSLMYAAARVADLPELRDLRTLFSEKFGNSLEPYTSKELIEKLRRDSPAREMKIQLLHDIAQEFSIEWNGKALEQRLSRHLSLHEERSNDKTDNIVTKEKHTDARDSINTSKEKERETSSQAMKKNFNNESYWKHQIISDDDGGDDESSTDMSSIHGRKASLSSLESIISEDEVETKRPNPYWLVPPPYLKQRTKKDENNNPKKTRTEYDTGQNRGNTRSSYARGKSLPYEHINSIDTTSKGHARSISLSNDEIKSGEGKVHPNLPDYDDLLARIRSLRGR